MHKFQNFVLSSGNVRNVTDFFGLQRGDIKMALSVCPSHCLSDHVSVQKIVTLTWILKLPGTVVPDIKTMCLTSFLPQWTRSELV